jgi:anti-sigma factor RsiW
MNCRQTRDLIDGYVDGELDLAHSLELERHVDECDGCAAARDARLALRDAIRGSDLRCSMPSGLACNVRAATLRRSYPRMIIGTIAALAAVLAIAFLPRITESSHDQRLLAEIASAHVRSLLADHLTDVASTDQHTVKPWFAGRIDYAPPVRNFAAQGFELIGGRLDYLDGRAVASLVYRRQKHAINVFIWPDDRAPVEPHFDLRDGFNIVRWRKGGMRGAAVSDLNAAELSELVKLIGAGP